MTVAQAIEELQKLPPDAELKACDGMGLSDPVSDFYLTDNGKTVWVNT